MGVNTCTEDVLIFSVSFHRIKKPKTVSEEMLRAIQMLHARPPDSDAVAQTAELPTKGARVSTEPAEDIQQQGWLSSALQPDWTRDSFSGDGCAPAFDNIV